MSLTVNYIGNFQPNLPKELNGGIPWSTESHYALSFEALGHKVNRIQESDPDAFEQALALPCDMLLWTRTWAVDEAKAYKMLLTLERQGVVTASVHLDIFRGLARSGRDEYAHPMFACQHVFTADGEEPEQWTSRGINHHWLRPGVLAAECVIGTPQPQFANYDVAFVGSRQYHPEWPQRPQLIDWLRQTYGDRFLHVGGDGNYPGNGHALRGMALNDLYASIPVFVGDSCFAHPSALYWSDRAYEAPGRGAFQLFPRINELERELWLCFSQSYYHGLEGLKELIEICFDIFRTDPEGRQEAVAAGSTFIRDNCSYEVRAAEILKVVGL